MSSDTAKSSSIFYTPKLCCLLLCPVSQHVAPPVFGVPSSLLPCLHVHCLQWHLLPYPLMLHLRTLNVPLKVAKGGFLWEFTVQYVHTLAKHLSKAFAVPG